MVYAEPLGVDLTHSIHVNAHNPSWFMWLEIVISNDETFIQDVSNKYVYVSYSLNIQKEQYCDDGCEWVWMIHRMEPISIPKLATEYGCSVEYACIVEKIFSGFLVVSSEFLK